MSTGQNGKCDSSHFDTLPDKTTLFKGLFRRSAALSHPFYWCLIQVLISSFTWKRLCHYFHFLLTTSPIKRLVITAQFALASTFFYLGYLYCLWSVERVEG